MSVIVMGMVWARHFGSQPKKTLSLKLADHADDEGRGIYPANESLAVECEMSVRTVQRIIREFENDGLLVLVREGGRGPSDPNEYDMDLSILNAIPLNAVAEKRLVYKARRDAKKGVTVSPITRNKGDTVSSKGDTGDKKGCHRVTQTVNKPLTTSNGAKAPVEGGDEKDLKEKEARPLSPIERKCLLTAWNEFEGSFNGSEANLMRISEKLAPDVLARATCLDRISIYKKLTSGRDHKIHYSTYIKDAKFDTGPINEEMQKLENNRKASENLKQQREAQVKLNPFGKAWMAVRIKLLEAGEPVDGIDGRYMNRDECPPFDDYVQVHRASDEWKAWAEWHAAKGYSFPKQKNEWIWVPTAEAPDHGKQMTWKREPFSGEFVAGWFTMCRKLGGGILRQTYDRCVRMNEPIALTWPIEREGDVVSIATDGDDFSILQIGLDAMGVMHLPQHPAAASYAVPTRIWIQAKDAAANVPAQGEGNEDYECL